MPHSRPLSIVHEQVSLICVRGRLDWAGLVQLQRQVDVLLDAGARFLIIDFSYADPCATRLADLLARTNDLVAHRAGWLRLIGPGGSAISLDEADHIASLTGSVSV